MHAEIITIGDEILIGQITDTNSAFIAAELNKVGISVYQITSVQDDLNHITQAFREAESRAAIVLITGGLGPTKDDITKRALCSYLNDKLVRNERVLAHVEDLFKNHIATPISDINRDQALVPSKAEVLHNAYGTAPGMWMSNNGTVFVSLPGVPFEMKNLLTREVIPRIIATFERPYIIHRTLMTYGLGESAIAARIEAWEDSLPSFIKLAYLPNLGKVRLRITAKGTDRKLIEKAVEEAVEKLYGIIGDLISGEEEQGSIEASVSRLFTEKHITLATAESFTGGKIAEMLTAIPGASAFFKGSVVSYATSTKVEVLQVPLELIKKNTVVSAAVAMHMAENVRHIMNAHYAVATTGNAGPTKGDSDAPIGTVYIAIATPDRVYAEKFNMGNHRTRIVQKSVHKAFEMLRKEILKI